MTENGRFQSQRSRTVLGLVVVALSMGLAVALAGVSFAQGSSSAAEYQYGKVTICHKAGKKKSVTITVAQSAWKAHQKHGDTLGACPKPNPSAPAPGTTAPATPGDTGKPADTPGNGNGKPDNPGKGKGKGK